MDYRKERTKRNIIQAFIELRAKKSLEKITVKELAEKALINKATFYTHYKDIYDLSEQLEKDAVNEVLKNISHPESIIEKPETGVRELFSAIIEQRGLFNILFSDTRYSLFVKRLEQGIKEKIYLLYPEYQNNLEWDVLFTVLIQGCFYAFSEHSDDTNTDDLVEIIVNINKRILEK